jgi:hypothetical protein
MLLQVYGYACMPVEAGCKIYFLYLKTKIIDAMITCRHGDGSFAFTKGVTGLGWAATLILLTGILQAKEPSPCLCPCLCYRKNVPV